MKNLKKMLLKRKIMKMGTLPNLPTNVLELMQMLRDPQVPAQDVINSINQDQVLAAQILKLVNSGYYSVRNRVNSIDHAVSLVGFVKVWEMLLSSSVMEIISGKEQDLWKHSYSSSILMREIVERHRIRCSPKIQLTMLMHDIGKIVLLNYNPATYQEIEEDSMRLHVPSAELEEERIGINHAEVGGWLLEAWDLTEDQIAPISQHHTRVVAPAYQCETVLIRFVDYIDDTIRGRPCECPSAQELEAGGLENLSIPDWQKRHEEIIEELGTRSLMDDENEDEKETATA